MYPGRGTKPDHADAGGRSGCLSGKSCSRKSARVKNHGTRGIIDAALLSVAHPGTRER